MIKNIGVFCGSYTGNKAIYSQHARQLARVMADADMRLVYGGAKVGIMGVIADAMIERNAEVLGVIPKSLVDVELAHPCITTLEIVDTMNQRKERLIDLSDAFVLLPGGAGSLDEFFEVYTQLLLGYHKKACCILNTAGYYDALIAFIDNAISNRFMDEACRNLVIIADQPEDLMDNLLNYQPPSFEKWQKSRSEEVVS